MKVKTPLRYLAFCLVASCCTNSFGQIANGFPNDINIQSDPNVLFTEMFEGSSISTLTASTNSTSTNWNQITTVTTNILFDSSVPAASTGTQSLRLRTIDDNTNANENTFIYKRIQPDILDSIFVRFYIKYDSLTEYHHSGVYIGGKNPPSSTAGLVGGVLVQGNKEFHVGAEIRGTANNTPTNTSTFGFYNYWMNMKASSITNTSTSLPYYYGNQFLNSTTNDDIHMTDWNCIEVMIKLNNPVTSYNGELALWVNGTKINHYGYNFPTGIWNFGNFTEGTGSPFEGYQWRNDPSLNLNYLWLKNFNDNNSFGHTANIYFDHIVVAKSYIGPINTGTAASISKHENHPRLNVYPNPTSNNINIKLNIEVQISSLKIYDINGKTVFDETSFDRTRSVNIKAPDLAGIYFLKIESDKGVFTSKIIKE